jgi:hypothetical protein
MRKLVKFAVEIDAHYIVKTSSVIFLVYCGAINAGRATLVLHLIVVLLVSLDSKFATLAGALCNNRDSIMKIQKHNV